MKNQAGFTLIELIMVIVILGVLAAVALPKFIDLSGDATAAVAKHDAGATSELNKISAACAAIPGGDCTVKNP